MLIIDEVDDLGIVHGLVIRSYELIQFLIVLSKSCLVNVLKPLKLSESVVSCSFLFTN